MAGVFIGVDVGSASARAGVFDDKGTLLAAARHPISIWRDADEVVGQSSRDIWSAVAACVREAVRQAGVAGAAVRGIGFDATCSLAVVDDDAWPLAVGPSEDPQRNVIMWMDHRAVAEARHINATAHPVLLCRRRHLARDADAETPVAQAASSENIRGGPTPLRSVGLPDLSCHRKPGAVGLHSNLQVDVSCARAAMGRHVL
jgi:glycerol kinase